MRRHDGPDRLIEATRRDEILGRIRAPTGCSPSWTSASTRTPGHRHRVRRVSEGGGARLLHRQYAALGSFTHNVLRSRQREET
jgi:hypothetical protein